MVADLVLGVDGGKSKTVCLIARGEEGVIGAGRAGSSDKYDVPLEQALDAVEKAVRAAAEQAGISLPVRAGCFGLAGADWPEDFEQLEQGLIARRLAEHVLVKNDMHIALHANAEYGVVLSAGTHAAAAIRTPDGREWHAGWFAVEGPGGVTAGHKVLWAVFRACDGRGPQTVLTDLVLAATGASDVLELLRAHSEGRIDDPYLARLAPLLFQAHYRYGDQVAAGIIMELGEDMARWATGLLARFNLLDAEVPIVLTGGLFKGEGTLLREVVSMWIHARAPKAVIQPARRESVIGAVLYAYEMLGSAVRPSLVEALERTLPSADFFRTA